MYQIQLRSLRPAGTAVESLRGGIWFVGVHPDVDVMRGGVKQRVFCHRRPVSFEPACSWDARPYTAFFFFFSRSLKWLKGTDGTLPPAYVARQQSPLSWVETTHTSRHSLLRTLCVFHVCSPLTAILPRAGLPHLVSLVTSTYCCYCCTHAKAAVARYRVALARGASCVECWSVGRFLKDSSGQDRFLVV